MSKRSGFADAIRGVPKYRGGIEPFLWSLFTHSLCPSSGSEAQRPKASSIKIPVMVFVVLFSALSAIYRAGSSGSIFRVDLLSVFEQRPFSKEQN